MLTREQDVKRLKKDDVLNREQTEEWKGWMQFMFLLYHYFNAEEVYNSIRVCEGKTAAFCDNAAPRVTSTGTH